MSSIIKNGTVAWFNKKKGFGSIKAEEGETFFHCNVVEGHHALEKGASVQFMAKSGIREGTMSAIKVVRI